jgi:muramoyltetrapeptide carboxypeptidase LdcA involved in peptidoglycan recycling
MLVQLEGRLVGGCMDCLVNLLGTRFDRVQDFNERYKEEGIIWFMESCDLNVMAIRRAIWQMKNAGWFSYVKGK